jgi:hypothetical protein
MATTAKVQPSAEPATRTGQHDHPAAVVLLGGCECGHHIAVHRGAEGIELLTHTLDVVHQGWRQFGVEGIGCDGALRSG